MIEIFEISNLQAWEIFNFTRVENPEGRAPRAMCGKCKQVQNNTSTGRLEKHYRRCTLGEKPSSKPVKRKQTKPKSTPKPSPKQTKRPEIKKDLESDEGDDYELWEEIEDDFDNESASLKPSLKIVTNDIERLRHTTTNGQQKRQSASTSTDSALSKFLIGCNLTFDIIDTVQFKNFIRAVKNNPDYEPPTSTQLKTRVLNAVEIVMDPTPPKKWKLSPDSE